MTYRRGYFAKPLSVIAAVSMLLTGIPQSVFADNATPDVSDYSYRYTRNATLMDEPGKELPGVYVAKAQPGDSNETIGIPSLAKQNLEGEPATESPAIIKGAAVPFERRVNSGATISFDRISDEPIYAPYSLFRYSLLDESNANTTGAHTKISGYDGTYVLLRIDVSELIKDAPAGSYLHFKQTDNRCMLVALGEKVTDDGNGNYSVTFSDALGGQAGSFSLDHDAQSLKDTDGPCQDGTYVTLILMSSGTLVAGADTGKEGAPPADFPISFYVDQKKDYEDEVDMIWDSATNTVLKKSTRQAVAEKTEGSKVITPATQYLDKFYNESKAPGATVTSYTVKGSDLELEVAIDETTDNGYTDTQYWSLRRAMDYEAFDDHTIKLLCEVPMLEGLTVSGSNRRVVLDLNSFDFQLANHSTTGAAAITVQDGATLTLTDGSRTTGAELAVGNNAKMLVTDGGTLVIDESCQMEVEYDAATTPAPTGEPTSTSTEPELTSGVLTIENGGRIVNNGVINVEGRENKALDPTVAVIRDTKDAVLSVSPGGTIENNGCMRVNGMLFNEGTIINNGRYSDTIESNDPDKGHLIFHKGIQISWKDDVTQGEAYGGSFINGMGFGKSEINPDARIENNGDLVLVPGNLFNLATIDNSGDMILSATNEVIVPITPTQDAPTVMEERVQLTGYTVSMLLNSADSYIYNEGGSIFTADFELVSNGRVGNMKDGASSDHENMRIVNLGELNNSASGYIDISRISNYGKVSNDASSTVNSKVILLQPSASFTDSARKKTADVYNAQKATNKTTDSWSYVEPAEFTVSPSSQMVPAGESATWTVRATVDGVSDNDKVQYLVGVESSRDDDEAIPNFVLPANKDITVTSPAAPADKTNVVYTFTAEEGVATAQATLRVNDDVSNLGIVRPVAMPDLVYNGMPQHLLSLGNTTDGVFQYRINGGEWSYGRPMATNAGEYTVDYRIVVSDTSTTPLDNGGTVKAVIAKRPLYIAANDLASIYGKDIAELTYTAYGLCDVDKDRIGLMLSTSATKESDPGAYPIKISVNEELEALKNYEYKDEYGDSRITGGVYYVSKDYLSLTPDPVTPAGGGSPVEQPPGIKSNLGGYQNLNCGIVLTAKYKNNQTDEDKNAVVANVYYSSDIPLTADNYETDGKKIAPTFAAVGTDATVYYCVAAPEGGFAGSQRVVITKADQEAPGIKETDPNGVLEVTQSTIKNVGGSIKGLQTMRSASKPPMEYRSADSEVYSTPTASEIKLPAGTYYVRRAGDARYNPSPDTEVVLTDGTGKLSVTYNANKGKFEDNNESKTVEADYGDLLDPPIPVRTTADGASVNFKGWTLSSGKAYDPTSRPVTSGLTLYADWDVTKYTVTFDYGDYKIPETVEAGEKVTNPGVPITGYKITGWKNSDGTAFDFDNTTINSDITLTADKTPYSYKVVFDGNGGNASSAMEAQNFTYGTPQELTANTFTRDGYTFAGWNTKSDGKGVAYADKEKVINLTETDNGEVILYAQWIKSLSDSNIKVTVGDKNEPAIYTAPFNGKAHRPNVTVMDGTTDITDYCRFVYSDNTNVTDSATITILPKSDTVPYSGKKEVKFAITKADAPAYETITRNYIYNDTVSESIDLSEYVPADAGAVKWKCEHTGNIRYKAVPAISGNTLSYTIRPASGVVEGDIKLTAVTDNYNDISVTVSISETALGLYEKVSNKYYRRTDAKLLEGKKVTLTALFADTSVVNTKVVWTSTNPGVASVSQTGVVTAYSAGTAIIEARSEENPANVFATCSLTVTEPVASISLSAKSYGMGVGERFTAEASVLPFTADKRLVWTANKEGIVRIDVSEDTMSAKIIALSRGSVKVTATAADGSGRKASVSVTVGDPVPAFDIVSKNKDNTLKVGATTSFKVDWKDSKPKNTGLYWRVSTITGGDASKIASIDPNKGVLKGISEGAVRVTAVSTSNNEKSASTQVYVYNPVKKVALNMTKATVSMAAGATKPQLIAYVTPAVAGMSATGTTFGTIPVVKFEVDSKYRANLAVDVKGFLTAKAATKDSIPVYATVTAYNGYSKTLTCKVSVSEANPLKSVKMSQSSIKIGEGNKAQLSALFTPVNPDGGCNVTWSSADTSIASVDAKGVVTGVKAGQVNITATAEGTVNKNGKEVHPVASCTVTVVPSVTAIEFTNVGVTGANIAIGKSFPIKTKFTASSGTKASTDLKWTSSNESIATVSSKGVVKAIAPGTVTITATSLDNKATGDAASKSVTFTVHSLVTSIVADKSRLTLGAQDGASANFGKISIAKVLPDNVTNPEVEWTADSDIVRIAAINQDDTPDESNFTTDTQTVATIAGKALAVCADKPGTVKITGKTTDGSNKKLTVTVTVRGYVTGVRLTPKNPDKKGYNGVSYNSADDQFESTMKAGGSLKVAPLVDINGIAADSTDRVAKKTYGTYKKYTDTGVSYRSNDASIATVDKNGTIKVGKNAAAGSTVTIYVSSTAGDRTARLVITVK